jgi:hypothetical protein
MVVLLGITADRRSAQKPLPNALGTPIDGWRSEPEVGAALGVGGEGHHTPSITGFSNFFKKNPHIFQLFIFGIIL